MSNMENENEFNLPRVGYTPIDTVAMEGQMFRGMGDSSRDKSLFVRIMSILIFLFLFFIPGIGLSLMLYSMISQFMIAPSTDSTDMIVSILGFIFAILACLFFLSIGIFGIRANIIKKRK